MQNSVRAFFARMQAAAREVRRTASMAGAAMLAAVACGEYASVEEAADAIVQVTETVEPELLLAAKYQEQYERFEKLYPAVKAWF